MIDFSELNRAIDTINETIANAAKEAEKSKAETIDKAIRIWTDFIEPDFRECYEILNKVGLLYKQQGVCGYCVHLIKERKLIGCVFFNPASYMVQFYTPTSPLINLKLDSKDGKNYFITWNKLDKGAVSTLCELVSHYDDTYKESLLKGVEMEVRKVLLEKAEKVNQLCEKAEKNSESIKDYL